jgi:hypothetical protein
LKTNSCSLNSQLNWQNLAKKFARGMEKHCKLLSQNTSGQREKRFIGLKTNSCNLKQHLNWQNLAKILARGMEKHYSLLSQNTSGQREKKGL